MTLSLLTKREVPLLLSLNLIDLVEKKSELLSKRWRKAISHHKLAPSYAELSNEELENRASNIYSSVSHWFDHSISKVEARKKYFALGKKRYREGFSILELTVALSLEKRILWDLIEEECFLDSSYNMSAALELMVDMMIFFDKALIHTIEGYNFEKNKGVAQKRVISPTGSWFVVPDEKDKK